MISKFTGITLLLLILTNITALGQEQVIHGYIDKKIVKINHVTGKIDSTLFEVDIPDNTQLVDLVYDKTNRLYYSIANPTDSPTLITISEEGEYNQVGAFTINNGTIYSAESLSHNKNKFYIAASLNGALSQNDFYSESLLEVNIENANCIFVTEILTDKSFPDIGVMTFVEDKIFFFDGSRPGLNFLSFCDFFLEQIQASTTPRELFSNTYLPISDFIYLDGYIYFTENYTFYSFDVSGKILKAISNIHNSNQFNSNIISGLTLAPGCLAPIVKLSSNQTLCFGDTNTIDAYFPNATYLWQDGSAFETLQVKESGTYSVVVSNGCGSSTDSVQVKFFDYPTINLGQDRVVCPGEILTFKHSSNVNNFKWGDGSTDSAIVIREAGIYSLTVANVCATVSDSVTITFPEMNNLFIPDIITANNDEKNEYFMIDQKIIGSDITIFNRSGKLV
jgi:hypothetical protein